MEIANKLFKDEMHDPIENVKKYKYLGITINAKNCSFNPTQIDLSCKATNALYAITQKHHSS